MSEETLQELSRNLKERVGENNSYHGFLDAMKNVEERIALLHKQDRYGRIKKMTREDREGLMELLKQVSLQAEGVSGNETDPETKQLVKKITALAAGNHRALLTYDPDREAKTLPTLLSEVRTLTLDTRGAKLKSEEVETSERGMKQALEEVNRRVGDKLEASQWEPGKQSPFEKTDFDAVKNDPQPQVSM